MTSKAGNKPRSYYKTDTNRPRKKNKANELIKRKNNLENRVKKEGTTKWLTNAMTIVDKLLKKAGLKK